MSELFLPIPPWAMYGIGGLTILGLVAIGILWDRRNVARRAERVAIFNEPQLLSEPSPEAANEPTVSIAELQRDYDQRIRAVVAREESVSGRIDELRVRTFESMDLLTLLKRGSPEERANLRSILKLNASSPIGILVREIGRAGSHVVGQLVRFGEGVSYTEVVRDVAKQLKATLPMGDSSIATLERAVLEAAVKKLLDNATPAQKQAILSDITKSGRGSLTGIGTTTAALAVANLSGFTLYSAASVTLAAVTGAAGVTLPFAAYMGMSSLLATVTGPVGWAALGAWAVYKFGGVNSKKTFPAVVLVASVRARLMAERDEKLGALSRERLGLKADAEDLERLRQFIELYRGQGPQYRVPTRDVPA